MIPPLFPRYYRKKPIVVTAVRVEDTSIIKTPNGDVTAYPGDYVICGVEGELYPCSPEVFAKTYERLDIKCTKCNRTLDVPDSSWRFNGRDWEHRCPGAHYALGHWNMRPFSHEDVITVIVQLEEGKEE